MSVLQSDAVATLPHAAFKVLVLLASQFTGYNNGALAMTEVYARRFGFKGRDTIYRSLKVLQERHLIVRTREGMKMKKQFSLYALGWEQIHSRDGKPLDRPEPANNHAWLAWNAPDAEPKIHTEERE